jgi:hypothetical protein
MNSRFKSIHFYHDPLWAANRTNSVANRLPLTHHHVVSDNPVLYDHALIAAMESIDESEKDWDGALVVGVGMAGLMLASVCERHPKTNMIVFAVNSPHTHEGYTLKKNKRLVSLYSSKFEPIKDTCSQWSKIAKVALDVPTLAHGMKLTSHFTAHMITSFIQGKDLNQVLEQLVKYDLIPEEEDDAASIKSLRSTSVHHRE